MTKSKSAVRVEILGGAGEVRRRGVKLSAGAQIDVRPDQAERLCAKKRARRVDGKSAASAEAEA